MNNTIKVMIKNVYGTNKVYPSCSTSILLAKLIGKKTFDREDISNMEKLGYRIEMVTPELIY